MQKRVLLACFLVASFPCVSSATAFHPIVALSLGLAKTNVYSSKSILFGSYPNSYIGTNHDDTEMATGFFIGGETVFLDNWAGQIGLSYVENKSFTENGNVYEFADPAFNNLTYQYRIKSRRVSLETKISHLFRHVLHPYVSASLGEAFNQAYAYTEYPVTSADVPMTQPFANHLSRSLTYSVGFGIDVDLTEHVRLGAGYRFADLGNANLGITPLQSSTNKISNTHLYTNEVLAQLEFVG